MKHNILKALLLGALLAFSSLAVSQEKTAKKSGTKAVKKDGKVDISDLQNKYWAPKDTDFSVVQNRTYTKNKRFSVNLHGGILVNDRYNEGNAFGLTGNYYLSERYGVEVAYTSVDPEDNQGVKDLIEFGGGVKPDHGKIQTIYDIGFNWIPFYAKMSVLGKKIMYFDMVFSPKIGMVEYDQQTQEGGVSQSAFTYGFDVTQMFFINEHWTVRVDLKNRWFDEKKVQWLKSTGDPNAFDSVGSTFNNTTIFSVGVQYFF